MNHRNRLLVISKVPAYVLFCLSVCASQLHLLFPLYLSLVNSGQPMMLVQSYRRQTKGKCCSFREKFFKSMICLIKDDKKCRIFSFNNENFFLEINTSEVCICLFVSMCIHTIALNHGFQVVCMFDFFFLFLHVTSYPCLHI